MVKKEVGVFYQWKSFCSSKYLQFVRARWQLEWLKKMVSKIPVSTRVLYRFSCRGDKIVAHSVHVLCDQQYYTWWINLWVFEEESSDKPWRFSVCEYIVLYLGCNYQNQLLRSLFEGGGYSFSMTKFWREIFHRKIGSKAFRLKLNNGVFPLFSLHHPFHLPGHYQS